MGNNWTLHFDGANEPINPRGIATYGFVLKGSSIRIGKGLAAAPGSEEATNNVAEYMGLIRGLEAAKEIVGSGERLLVYGDSQLVIRQLSGQYAVNAKHLIPLHAKASLILHDFRLSNRPVDVSWIPREQNHEADKLSKEAVKDALKEDPEILKKILMPFGKHQGKTLQELPDSYYQWLWTNKGGTVLIPQRQNV